MIIIVAVSLIIGIVVSYIEDSRFTEEMSKYTMIAKKDSLTINVNSAVYVDKNFIINNTWACYGIKNQKPHPIFLSDYLRKGDFLVKRRNNDTLYVLRNYQIEKFVIMRDDGSEPILNPKEMMKLWFNMWKILNGVLNLFETEE